MGIRVRCPQGHVLQVSDDSFGKVGRCPVCKSLVQVPVPVPDDFPEDAIMHILGKPSPRVRKESGDDSLPRSRADAGHGPPKKACAKCNREIESGTHICPYCHTYIAGLADV